ncbi:MAG: hypothetical protein PHV54_01525 [Tolumonas sp.]|nr:hypothetical protein [Tolumonas sp.]
MTTEPEVTLPDALAWLKTHTGAYPAKILEFVENKESLVKAERERCARICEQSEIPFDLELWRLSTKKEMTAHTARALADLIRTNKAGAE